MLEHLKYGTYIFFAAFCILMFLWVWFLVPETRNKTLEEMDRVFGDQSGQEDIARLQQIMRELGLQAGQGGVLGAEGKEGVEEDS
jgi:hypothetical protein